MPDIILEKATENDILQIQKLAIATWEPTYGSILAKDQVEFMQEEIYTPEALKAQMESGQEFYFVLFNAEQIGFLAISALHDREQTFKLNKIYLLSEVQGKGFGKKALVAAENLVIKKGGKSLLLNVNRFNQAQKFYENCGYKIIKEEDIPIGKYWMNDYVMQKFLS